MVRAPARVRGSGDQAQRALGRVLGVGEPRPAAAAADVGALALAVEGPHRLAADRASRSTAGLAHPSGGERRQDDVLEHLAYEEQPRPAVIPHPVTGRPILFVNPMHVHGFVGMSREAAWELIEELAAHSVQDRFVYYHSWRVGDVLMWDERATMHRGAARWSAMNCRQ